MSAEQRRKKTAAERRAQRLRAEARCAQRLLRGFDDLVAHRGCRPTRLGLALQAALRGQGCPDLPGEAAQGADGLAASS